MRSRAGAWLNWALAIIAIASIAGWALIERHPWSQDRWPRLVGSKSPPLRIATTSGPFDIYRTKRPVLLEIFATWCGHCKRETTTLNRLYSNFKADVDFVAVASSPYAVDGLSPSSVRDAARFDRVLRVRYPTAYDKSLYAVRTFAAGGYPTILIINRDKRVVWQTAGNAPYDDLAPVLAQVAQGACEDQTCRSMTPTER